MGKGVPAAGAPSQEPGPVYHAATAITAPDTDHLPAYWQFHDAVAQAQLLAWLPRGRHMIVDVSGPRSPGGELDARPGPQVLRVIAAAPPASQRAAGAACTDERGTSEEGRRRLKGGPEASGKIRADSSRLSFLPDECADEVRA